jgi:ATP-dependent DNA helicase RecG
MTATPIPRTLAMTVYGDLDVSILDEMPQGRKQIKTYWRSYDKRSEIYQWVKEKVSEGEQAYIVFPLVEESEKIDLKAAKESWAQLSSGLFEGINMGLLHGRLSSDEKDAIMAAFKNGEYKVLVSTTVIEVGVDVPQATIMVVEHAERFGLTQLHQLRGRVGRGAQQSYCILIDYPPLTAEARARLHAMVETTDGFKIAETDLTLRGPGEFFGTRQHGLPALRIANIIDDAKILAEARQEAFKLLETDSWSQQSENIGVRDYFKRHYEERLGYAEIA